MTQAERREIIRLASLFYMPHQLRLSWTIPQRALLGMTPEDAEPQRTIEMLKTMAAESYPEFSEIGK